MGKASSEGPGEKICQLNIDMTSLLARDDVSINRINPYTLTQVFGISYNGGKYKDGVLRVESEVDDDVSPAGPDTGVPKDHFNSLTLDDAGNRYLGTGGVHPATSFMYPARKFQYDDGSTNFSREVVLTDARNYVTPDDFKVSDHTMMRFLFIGILVALLLMLIQSKSFPLLK